MPRSPRVLCIAFSSPEEFEREYASNLVNAGVFIATDEPLDLREAVRVEICLEFADRSVSLDGEVVHRVGPEMAAAGATRGVAVQFGEAAHHVRDRLAPLIEASGSFQREPQDTGQRSHPRVPARVPVEIDGGREAVSGRTRNLSRSGVLVSVEGTDVPVGGNVKLSLVHPENGRAMEVQGCVVRQVHTEGDVTALGIQFDPSQAQDGAFRELVEAIQTAEHSRRLGGIQGSIAELGPQNLLQMFGTSTQEGTLTLIQGEQEGVIGFERGLLRYARLGTATGMKALTRLLSWRDGRFDFHARLEPLDNGDAPLPLEAAVLEAMRQIDESLRAEPQRFSPAARLRLLDAEAAASDTASKVEQAVVDLARAGFSVARIVEVIPEPDPEIYAAIDGLIDRGIVACDG